MKLYRVEELGTIGGLRLREEAFPEPGDHEVVVRVRATSLNYRDLAIIRLEYGGPAPDLNFVPLSDGAGEIVKLGGKVRGWSVGDRVAGLFRQNWLGGKMPLRTVKTDLGANLDGMLAEAVALNEEGIVKLPDHLSFEEGATLPCAALTAWNALNAGVPIKPGHTVLVLGSGGVSIFAMQFAKSIGARVLATTSSDEKAARLRSMGADHVINYRTSPEWENAVMEFTGGTGADRILETGGGSSIDRSLRAAAVNGSVIVIGVLADNGKIDPLPILLRRLTVKAISTGSREMFEDMNAAISNWQLQPVIDRIFSFDQAPQAYEYLASGGHIGKIVIRHP